MFLLVCSFALVALSAGYSSGSDKDYYYGNRGFSGVGGRFGSFGFGGGFDRNFGSMGYLGKYSNLYNNYHSGYDRYNNGFSNMGYNPFRYSQYGYSDDDDRVFGYGSAPYGYGSSSLYNGFSSFPYRSYGSYGGNDDYSAGYRYAGAFPRSFNSFRNFGGSGRSFLKRKSSY